MCRTPLLKGGWGVWVRWRRGIHHRWGVRRAVWLAWEGRERRTSFNRTRPNTRWLPRTCSRLRTSVRFWLFPGIFKRWGGRWRRAGRYWVTWRKDGRKDGRRQRFGSNRGSLLRRTWDLLQCSLRVNRTVLRVRPVLGDRHSANNPGWLTLGCVRVCEMCRVVVNTSLCGGCRWTT